MDLSDKNLIRDIVYHLRVVGEAIERRDYEVHYSITTDRIQGYSKNPEKAVEQYLDEMRKNKYIKTEMSTSIILGLFEEGSSEHIDNALNEVLSNVWGRIHVDDPTIDEVDPAILYADINYYPKIDGGHFELESGKARSEAYLYEFKDILEEKSFPVKQL